MQTVRTEKIGNVVLDYSHYPEQDFYCDGSVRGCTFGAGKNNPAPGISPGNL